MDIIKQIKASAASVRQLSILADIPEDRMYKWVNGTSNPKAEDITTLEDVFREISDLSKDQIKKLVDTRRIGTNKEFEQKLKIATGNKNIKIQGIEELDKLRSKKDVNVGASNTKGSRLQHPHSKTKADEEDIYMQIELAKQLRVKDEQLAKKDSQIMTKDTHIDRLLTIIEKITGVEIETDKPLKSRQAKSA